MGKTPRLRKPHRLDSPLLLASLVLQRSFSCFVTMESPIMLVVSVPPCLGYDQGAPTVLEVGRHKS